MPKPVLLPLCWKPLAKREIEKRGDRFQLTAPTCHCQRGGTLPATQHGGTKWRMADSGAHSASTICRSTKSSTTDLWSINVTLGTQRRHEGCVLEADHAGTHHDDFFRKAIQVSKVIRIHNAMNAMRWSCHGELERAYWLSPFWERRCSNAPKQTESQGPPWENQSYESIAALQMHRPRWRGGPCPQSPSRPLGHRLATVSYSRCY